MGARQYAGHQESSQRGIEVLGAYPQYWTVTEAIVEKWKAVAKV
jgi:hypothetical protein